MRRKPGSIVPTERAILEAGLHLDTGGTHEFHGYMLAKQMRDDDAARRLIGHGTLYKALDRLQRSGFLESEWEDPLLAAQEGRPRRRLYHVTAAGEAALVEAVKAAPQTAAPQRRTGMASP
jgi:DNA-binding PadR family transcriptional regulator